MAPQPFDSGGVRLRFDSDSSSENVSHTALSCSSDCESNCGSNPESSEISLLEEGNQMITLNAYDEPDTVPPIRSSFVKIDPRQDE